MVPICEMIKITSDNRASLSVLTGPKVALLTEVFCKIGVDTYNFLFSSLMILMMFWMMLCGQ